MPSLVSTYIVLCDIRDQVVLAKTMMVNNSTNFNKTNDHLSYIFVPSLVRTYIVL